MKPIFDRLYCLILLVRFITLASGDQTSQLIFSHALGLDSLNLTSLLTQELHTNGHNIFDLDLLWSDSIPHLFWSDFQEGKVYSAILKDGVLENVKMIVSHGIVSVEGIAVDWIANNLYLVESRYGWIEVTDLKYKWRSVVITNIDSPRALALDSRDGLMFWTDRSENQPKIERSSMSGENRIAIVDINKLSDGGLPNGLTIDYMNRRLYWIDAKSDSIYSVDYDGSEMLVHFCNSNIIQSPFGLSFYNDDLFWVDAKLNSINKINIHNYSAPEVLYRTYHSLYGVVAIHENHHPKQEFNPCLLLGCSHLCLLDVKSEAGCRCPQLMTLGPDGKNCHEVEDMILVSEFHKEGSDGFSVILGLSDKLVKPLTIPIIPPSHSEIVGLELDGGSGFIYWVDATTNTMWKASLLGTNISKQFHLGNGKVTGFGADWKNSTIYYSSVGKDNGIFSCSIISRACVSIINGLHEPQLLAIHANLQKLFWIEKKVRHLHIVSSNLDGSNSTVIYSANNDGQLDLFKSFTLDSTGSDLYWIDTIKNVILHYNMKTIRTVANLNSFVKINTLMIDKERILLSDSSGKIHALNKFNGTYITVIYNSTGDIRSLRPVKTSSLALNIINPCSVDNGGCTEKCIYDSNGEVTCLPWPTLVPDYINIEALSDNITLNAQTSCLLNCKNEGRCESSSSGDYFCHCHKGYYGHLCQYSVCQNYCVNGQCYLNDKDQPLCVCPADYYGMNCEQSVCNNFCQHGLCQLVQEKQTCVCNFGWTGSMCHITKSLGYHNSSESYEKICLNNGEFVLDENGFAINCSCVLGYTGEGCEIKSSINALRLALILVSIGWGMTLLLTASVMILKRFCKIDAIFNKRRAYYKPKHQLLVDYNSNSPNETGAVYNVLVSPNVPRQLKLLRSKRPEADDRKRLTECEEINEKLGNNNWENSNLNL